MENIYNVVIFDEQIIYQLYSPTSNQGISGSVFCDIVWYFGAGL